jgi:hypothetical protein
MGKAGIKLKTAKTIFTMKNKKKNYSHLHRLIIAPPALCIFWKRYKKPVIIAKKTLTRGPCKATISSSAGFSGSLSNRAKPPMEAM